MIGVVEIAIIAFFVALTVVVIVGYTLPYWRQRQRQSGRAIKRDTQGAVVVIGEREPDIPLHFEGKGTWSSKPIPLAAGSYRIAYHFPADVPVRLGLISSFDGEDTTLLIKSGSGMEGFALESGSYMLQVQPAAESAAWSIELQPLRRLPRAEEEEKY